MSDTIKEQVRPTYEELKGYLSAFPPSEKDYWPENSYYWTSIGGCIEELNKITGSNYDKFKINVIPRNGGAPEHISNHEYRSKVNGLIMKLKGTYFMDDNPFGGSPMVSVNQTQNVQVTMLLEMSTLIDKQLYGEASKTLKPEEQSFLEKVKAALPTIKSTAELLGLVIKTAKDSGIDLHSLAHLFGL